MGTKEVRKRRAIEVGGTLYDSRHARGALVDLGGGAAVLRHHTVTIGEPELGVDLALEVFFDDATQRLDVREFTVKSRDHGPPITSELLRELRLADYMAEYLIRSAKTFAMVKVGDRSYQPDGLRRLEGEDELVYVARVYRIANAYSYKPTRAVQEALGVAESTAAQKVSLARKLGLLPPTTPGKARA